MGAHEVGIRGGGKGFSFVQSIISTNVIKALSVHQPWAWAIIYALKDIENRGWPIHYRGDILIHATKTCTKKEYFEAKVFCQSMGVVIPELISLRRGQVIGIVTIVDCQFSQVASGWGMPLQYHWQLENPREITPISKLNEVVTNPVGLQNRT